MGEVSLGLGTPDGRHKCLTRNEFSWRVGISVMSKKIVGSLFPSSIRGVVSWDATEC